MRPAGLLLAAMVAFAPWLEGGATPEGLAVLHGGVLALAAAVLLGSRREGRLDLRLTPPALAWLLFTAWGGMILWRAGYLYGAFDTWWDQVIMLILILALSARRPDPWIRRALPALVVLLGAAQALPALVTRFTRGSAISYSFLNPNHLAAYLNVAALVALQRGGWLGRGGASSSGRRARLGYRLGALACLGGTVATGSRGGLLALAVVLAALALRLRRAAPRLARGLALALALVALAGALSVSHRFATHVDPYRYDRPRLWMTAVQTWWEAPAAGHGPGMYEQKAPAHAFPQDAAVFRYSKQPRSAHSQPLQVLAEEGLVGLALLALFAGAAFASLARAARRGGPEGAWSRATLAAAAVVTIHSLVEMPFQPPAIPLTLAAMIWLALDTPAGERPAVAAHWRWPRGSGSAPARLAAGLSATAALWVLFAVGVAGPYLSYAAARYAETPGRPPVRVDLAARLSEHLNPWQPYLGYRRARAALARVERISPPLLANALASLDKARRLAPDDPAPPAMEAGLYRRAAGDLPGAGPGAVEAAGRLHDRALEIAPRDARLWIDRATFRLAAGFPEGALADAEEAMALEPASTTARHVQAEALAALGRDAEARQALEALADLRRAMAGYVPLNGYEASLLRLDLDRVEELRDRLGSVVPPPV